MIEQFFGTILPEQVKVYTDYWKSIAPDSDDEILRRWLFAFTSIHTTWESNVRGYNAIKNFEDWISDRELLRQKLIDSKCGLHNMRTKYIWDFATDFIDSPSEYHRKQEETWAEFRNRLVAKCKGIGMAKVSFTLEMCFPDEAEVVCLDTHMLQLYGISNRIKFDGNAGRKIYTAHEDDWIDRSRTSGASPYIARQIYWDQKQNQPDSRYWSYVLE
jgi:thermostable 8-oxoguanine DNA glycosylase